MAEVPIWIVSADHWPRALVRAELIERGYDATGFATLEDAVTGLMLTRARRPALLGWWAGVRNATLPHRDQKLTLARQKLA